MISFVITFFTIAFLQPSHAYYLSTCLVAIICFSLFAQYFWFNKPFKALFACIITVFCVGMMDTLCLTVIAAEQYDASVVFDGLKHTATDAITIIVIGGLLHVFFTFTPDDIKGIFPIGYGYTKKYQNNEQLQRNLRKTRVSVKITAIIIGVELILGISVAGFMAILFPDVTRMLADDIHEQTTFDNIDFASIPEGEQFKEIITDEISNLNYKFDTSMLSFDIKMILLMLCVGVPLAGITNYYTKMTIGGPIGIMSDFMYEFANAPDANKDSFTERVDRIHIRNNDEIGVMYEAMRSTVYETEAYINRLKEEQRLERDLEVAKKASEAKSSFLSNMSHEIRTPINAVLGMNEMILRESNEEQILEYASNVKSAGNSLLSHVNDILDFSKIEAGKMEILPVQYHLGSLINDLINLIASRAADKNLEFEINVDEHIPANLIGDEIRIKQCVTNILTNAVKYTEKGKVTFNVSCEKLNDINIMLRFQVVDTGIGIKEEDIHKLYSPFERIEEIKNRSIEGTGLGMSIVKKLLALMDTRLEVKSVYGEGSDFSFALKQQVVSWDEIGDFKTK
ncbi:MAG: hybrid sensor histidine kinase/response regulator, partial [Pseudobutyrivibrio sp.]|nr:hybrid sensor histidine kinase/response regulator [Pseudobutyrivibrio sp.]